MELSGDAIASLTRCEVVNCSAQTGGAISVEASLLEARCPESFCVLLSVRPATSRNLT